MEAPTARALARTVPSSSSPSVAAPAAQARLPLAKVDAPAPGPPKGGLSRISRREAISEIG
jgi:hypothetical protein